MTGFRARCRREEWRAFTAENVAAAGDGAPCRCSKGDNVILVRCDKTFTDPATFTTHMRMVHRVFPIKHAKPPLTEPHDYQTGPILTRLARRKPDPNLGDFDRLIGDEEAAAC